MIMRRRFGRPGLLGTMARTAVVAGTARAVTGGMQEQQAAPPTPPAGGGGDDMIAELEKLASLKSAGILTDDEFAAAKARLLGPTA